MRFAPPGAADAQLVPLQGNSTPQTPNITVPSRVHDTRGPILELQNRDPDFQLLLPRKHLSQPPRKSGPVANALNDSATGAPRRRPCSNRYPHAIFYIKLQFQGCRKSPKRDGPFGPWTSRPRLSTAIFGFYDVELPPRERNLRPTGPWLHALGPQKMPRSGPRTLTKMQYHPVLSHCNAHPVGQQGK